MLRVSTKMTALLAALSIFATTSYADDPVWPLAGTPDLSSGFGDLRANRFHAGIDLRTGGKIGAKVFSPAEGYLWRVKMSYQGYGKGLYVRTADGHTYVFAHLSELAPKIRTVVQAAQFEAERYYVDLVFPSDSIPIRAGELIGFSGQTGVGAPHLHFEKRSPDNRPINPLSHQFDLKDNIQPVFWRLGIHLQDGRSLFPDGRRKKFFPVRQAGEGKFVVDTALYLDAPFGLLVDCYDQMRPGSMRQSIYDLKVSVDGQDLYQVKLDSLDFASGSMVNLIFDPSEAAAGAKRVRRLYHRRGNRISGAKALNDHGGLFGLTGQEKYGLHEGLIVGEDVFGNHSELRFRFYWGPSGDLYRLDTTLAADDSWDYFLAPTGPRHGLRIDSIVGQMWTYPRHLGWMDWTATQLTQLDDDWLKIRSVFFEEVTNSRISCYTNLPVVLRQAVFPDAQLGLRYNPRPYAITNSVEDDGLAVDALLSDMFDGVGFLRLYQGEQQVAEIQNKSELWAMKISFFVPTAAVTSVVDRYEIDLAGGILSEQINLIPIGREASEIISVPGLCNLIVTRSDFFEPRLITVESASMPEGTTSPLIGAPFKISPPGFATKDKFDLTAPLPHDSVNYSHAGLCWYDSKEREWVWINENPARPDLASGSTIGGGVFAVLEDNQPPVISKLNIKAGHTYTNLRPTVRFLAKDNLSGFEDDLAFDVRVDNKWLLPQFDFETGQCVATLAGPLSVGRHRLSIVVVDRAGLKSERLVDFDVIKQ